MRRERVAQCKRFNSLRSGRSSAAPSDWPRSAGSACSRPPGGVAGLLYLVVSNALLARGLRTESGRAALRSMGERGDGGALLARRRRDGAGRDILHGPPVPGAVLAASRHPLSRSRPTRWSWLGGAARASVSELGARFDMEVARTCCSSSAPTSRGCARACGRALLIGALRYLHRRGPVLPWMRAALALLAQGIAGHRAPAASGLFPEWCVERTLRSACCWSPSVPLRDRLRGSCARTHGVVASRSRRRLVWPVSSPSEGCRTLRSASRSEGVGPTATDGSSARHWLHEPVKIGASTPIWSSARAGGPRRCRRRSRG